MGKGGEKHSLVKQSEHLWERESTILFSKWKKGEKFFKRLGQSQYIEIQGKLMAVVFRCQWILRVSFDVRFFQKIGN